MPNVVIAAKTRVADEGSLLTNNPILLDFVGAGVTASQVGTTTQINIPGPTPIGPEGLITFGPTGSGADYEADGTSDDVEWALLQADPRLATGGAVMLLNGVYNWTAGVAPDFRNSLGNPLTILCSRRGGVTLNFNKTGGASIFWGLHHKGLSIVNTAGAGEAIPVFVGTVTTVFDDCSIGARIQMTGGTAHFKDSTFGSLTAVNTVGGGTSWYLENCTVNNLFFNVGGSLVAVKTTFTPNFSLTASSTSSGGCVLLGCSIPAWNAGTGNITDIVVMGCALGAAPPSGIRGVIKNNTPNTRNNDFRDSGLSSASAILDFSQERFRRYTLDSNPVLTLTGAAPGDTLKIVFIQNAVGGFGVTWPGNVRWTGGAAPVLTAAALARSLVILYYDGTDYYGDYVLNI